MKLLAEYIPFRPGSRPATYGDFFPLFCSGTSAGNSPGVEESGNSRRGEPDSSRITGLCGSSWGARLYMPSSSGLSYVDPNCCWPRCFCFSLRRKYQKAHRARAIPAIGPMTAPAIQALFSDESEEGDGSDVSEDVGVDVDVGGVVVDSVTVAPTYVDNIHQYLSVRAWVFPFRKWWNAYHLKQWSWRANFYKQCPRRSFRSRSVRSRIFLRGGKTRRFSWTGMRQFPRYHFPRYHFPLANVEGIGDCRR